MRLAAFALVVLTLPTTARGGDEFLLKDGKRVVFLGDSNTFAGKFIAYLDAYLCTRFPERRIELINLGLPSETVSGLSEADHPYPRPDVHERAARALELTRPDVVVVCYGMNDGIYSPYAAERFEKYKDGILRLVEKCEKAGAKVVLMTPAPFDPVPLKAKVLPKIAEKFSWLRPYEQYDEEVLTRYADWLVTLREKKYPVVDAHAALLRHLAAMRKADPAYRVSGDGIHPDANGHLVIALELLKELKAPAAVTEISIDLTGKPGLKFSRAIPLPMPTDPAWSPKVIAAEKFGERVNRYPLKVAGLSGDLMIRAGNDKRISVSADAIARGVDLADLLRPPAETTAAVWKKVEQKNSVLGLAWLTHVGHKRPDTPKGLPLAEATEKAAALDREIRQLCKPTEVTLEIGPAVK
jgi:lysophospholipase L1-like esterase